MRPFVYVGGHLLEVERYVEHDAGYWIHGIGSRSACRFSGVHILADEDHRASLQPDRRAPISNHIEPDQALAGTLRGVQRMRAWNPTADEVVLAASFEELAHLVHDAERNSVSALPRQLVHGDFWGNNVLFLGDTVVLVLDLDFMAERVRIDDLALTLFFANSSIGGDRLSMDRIRQLRVLVDAYDSGLSDHLSAAERRACRQQSPARPCGPSAGGFRLCPEGRARRNAASRAVDVEWTLGLMRNLREWQEVCTGGCLLRGSSVEK